MIKKLDILGAFDIFSRVRSAFPEELAVFVGEQSAERKLLPIFVCDRCGAEKSAAVFFKIIECVPAVCVNIKIFSVRENKVQLVVWSHIANDGLYQIKPLIESKP